MNKVKMQKKKKKKKTTEKLKFHDFNICPNILHANADADADACPLWGIAIALLH